MNPMFNEETSFIRAEWPSEDSEDEITEQWDSKTGNTDDDSDNDVDSEEDHRVHRHRHEVPERIVLCSVML